MPWAIIVATLLSFSGTINGISKKWTPNVDFEDPVNWDVGHVPSSVDIAVFQSDTAVPIVLPSIGINVCEMLLPLNGQLIMEPYANLIISASSKDTGGCTGQTAIFKPNTPMEWVDPDNWSTEKITQAAPHVERIPCVHDTVVFSPHNSFSITMPDIPINIGTMNYGNQTFSQNELNEFLVTDVGDQELKSSSPNNDVSITLIGTRCDDYTGCECGTQQLLDQVCQVASKRCDNKLGCVSPVKPIGHCCWICGAYYLVDYSPKYFFINKFNEELEKDTDKIKSTYGKYQISFHASKLLNGKLQVVLMTNTKYVDEINNIAGIVNSILTSYIKRNMSITNVQMLNSGLSYDVDGMTYGQKFLATCVIIISFLMVTIFYYTSNWRSFLFGSESGNGVFVKYENYTNDVELINEDERLQRKSSFDNPIYGAVENMAQNQTFSDVLTYMDLSTGSTIPNDKMDVELKETSEQK